MAYLVGQSDNPTVYEPTNEDGADWAESETVMELEGLATQLTQLNDEARRIVAATIREVYKIEREAGRLEEGYTVNITAKSSV